MESKKINQLATELAPDLSDLTIIGDPTTGISKKITLSQMASLFTGTVEEYANLAAFPLVGVADTIYIALDTNVIYRYDTSLSAYVILSPNIINSLVFSDANGFDGTITLVGSVATLSITTALTLGSVPFIGASGALTQDNANLFFDDTNNRLGIATALPTTPLDVFGSGIIGRLNATSTNNAFLGFASNGTNKWSAGNVQSDHRFRIFSEANSAELITILQTGEFGIGIANPLTKFHIDGGATALIANLDANVSVAKSVSFRSDNSSRINLEVSGTESGSNAGADFFIRRYSDAGSLIDTPLTITRSTGAISLSTALSGTSASFSSTATATAFIPSGATVPTNGIYLSAANTLNFATNTTNRLSISSTGAATFSSTVNVNGATATTNLNVLGVAGTMVATTATNQQLRITAPTTTANAGAGIRFDASSGAKEATANIGVVNNATGNTGSLVFNVYNGGADFPEQMRITSVGQIGIGVTPSSWSSNNSIKPIQNPAGTFWNFDVGNLYVGLNYYYDGSNRRYITSSEYAAEYQQNGNHIFFTAPVGTAGNVVTLTERMRITNAGEVGIGNTGIATVRLSVTGANQASSDYSFISYDSNGNVLLMTRNDGAFNTGLAASSPYNLTTGNAANATLGSDGFMRRNTSSLKYKTDVKDYDKGLDIVNQMRPVYYKGINDGDKQFAGLIAEEIHELGLIEFVQYAEDGTPDALAYQNMIALAFKAIQELKAEIDILKAK